MLAFVEKHQIKPVIERSFPLAEAKEALLYLESSHKFGKVVVTI
jgi:NADPH:quinone reductase-like Zn-dependent oxidoreductase